MIKTILFDMSYKFSSFTFYLIDSFQNDDDFLAVLLVMGAFFCLFAVIIGVILVLTVFAILLALISGGILSASVLVGLHQRSVSKGFKTLFLSVSILGTTVISVIFFWFMNRIQHWWGNDFSVFAGIIFGLLSGWLLGTLIFMAVKKLVLFLKNKYDARINRENKKIGNDEVL